MQIVIGILFVVVLLTLFAAQFEKISHQRKMHILKVAALILLLAWLYQNMIDTQTQKRRAKVIAFKQGKTLICQDNPISQKFFYYESGTQSFLTNDKNSSLNGIIYPIQECEIKEGS